MAVELAPHKIRVNRIAPVMGATVFLEQFMGLQDTPENRAKFIATVPPWQAFHAARHRQRLPLACLGRGGVRHRRRAGGRRRPNHLTARPGFAGFARIAAAVVPERRSLIRDRSKSKRLPFCDPGSRFAWPGRRSLGQIGASA
jgi:hypothetical protein